MKATTNLTVILGLLRQVTSIDVVRSFLKAKGLTHSAGSWDFLIDKRIRPAIEDGSLTKDELADLLAELEESGRQHIFLYSIPQDYADKLMDEGYVADKAVALDPALQDVINNPLILDKPTKPTIASIRWGSESGQKTLIIKVIETRTSKKSIGEVRDGNFLTVKYEMVQERAINMMKVFSDGNMEIRLSSKSSSNHYHDELKDFWGLMTAFIPHSVPRQISIGKLKDKLWTDKDLLSDIIRFSSSTLMNDLGTKLHATTSNDESDLVSDSGAAKSLNQFMEVDGYCSSSNVWFLEGPSGIPSKKIHVLLSGEMHEFAITMHCRKADYDYVIGKIRFLNS